MLRARYDNDGNIILPSEEGERAPAEQAFLPPIPFVEEAAFDAPMIDEIQWGLPVEQSEDISNLPSVQRDHAKRRIVEELSAVRISCASALEEVENEALDAARHVLAEGERQVRASIGDGLTVSHGLLDELRVSLRELGKFLTQPVLVPTRKRTVKEYSRSTLFVLDIVRFGGTFAAIFAVLFSAMNYQSFAAIASARIEPILAFTNLDPAASVQKSLAEKLQHVPTLPTAGETNGGLAAYLPEVGPPNDILIIPKLNLHAPIVSPSTDSLLREDWKQLETDIQQGLENGVVHYPGTAEPGQAGNFFITGHSSYFPWAAGDYKSVFARLGELSIGDEFWVYHGGDKHRYVIDVRKEIVPSDVTVLDQPTNKRIATLMTCTPVGTTLRRLIISAEEVDPASGDPLDVGEHQQDERPAINIEALPI